MDNSKREAQIMNIQFKCPQCGQMVEADESVIGQTASCPYCGKKIIVPKDRIQNRSTTVENEDVPLRKPISTNAAVSALLSCLNVKSLALFSAICCVLIIIIQSIMLIVLFAQRTAVNNSGHMANSILNANSNQTETPSEQFLKYIEQGEVSYVKEVLKQNPALDVNRPRAADNKTALYIACERGYADVAKFLLDKKADASVCDTEKETIRTSTKYSPLTIAARNGHLAVVKVLLSSGIDIEARDDCDRTALYAAAAGNKPDVVRFLCESNAKVNIQARNNHWTPLTAAAHNGYGEVVKALLKYGKGIDLEMRDGAEQHTPLFHAARENQAEVVKILCEAGANVNADNSHYAYEKTPLAVAKYRNHTKVVEILEEYLSKGDRPQEMPQNESNQSPKSRLDSATDTSQEAKAQHSVEKPTKEFSGQISRVDDDCVVIVRDFSKSGVFFGIERKVRLDGITITDKTGAKDFVRRRRSGKVRVTYKDLDEAKNVKGTIWEDGGNGIRVKNIWTGEVATKSLNDILVDQGYASYDKQTK